MTQVEINEKMIDQIEQLQNLMKEQQKEIENMRGVLLALKDPVINSLETIQRHEDGINMIMKRLIELGFDK
ncbi:MAG: hypothetical protein LKJ17_10680 [Oscillospiraceae bacterium]|jgi:hypothetical protein|nr:hypothetical protein [Oscillospiraceae bacterium]